MEKITKRIAFDLFKIWTKEAIVDYPNNDFTLIDETNLVNDLKDSLSSAVRCLVKEEKAEQRRVLGYDYGFIVGFIQGNLNKSLLGFCFWRLKRWIFCPDAGKLSRNSSAIAI